MSTFLVLGGYGEMGCVTVHDLFATSRGHIIVSGRDARAAAKFARSFKSKRVFAAAVDVRNTKKLAALIKKCSVVINCTQYTWNLHVMRGCEIARKPYLDLGGLFHMTKKQLAFHSRWKKKGLLAVLGCGSTPGITNVLAAYGASLLDRVSEIHIRFADYDPVVKKSYFAFPYSAATIFDEFTKKAAVYKKGELIFVRAMTGREEELFPKPIGKTSEYYTLHSELATFPTSFKNKGLKECSFKVSFPDKFIHAVKRFIKSGKNAVTKEKSTFKGPLKDLEYIRIRMKGIRKGKAASLIFDCITKAKAKWKAPAGAYDTGVPPSIIAQMIMNGKIKYTGVLPPEKCVEPEYFFRELRRRGMRIKVSRVSRVSRVVK